MGFRILRHLAAISPYYKIHQQPAFPASRTIDSAVYLIRHGVICVNGHDYYSITSPFLQKLQKLQQGKNVLVPNSLNFLTNYSTWIAKDDVGRISPVGIDHCHSLGSAFRTRYSAWLDSKPSGPPLSMRIWADSTQRCVRSAQAFGEGFSGKAFSSFP